MVHYKLVEAVAYPPPGRHMQTWIMTTKFFCNCACTFFCCLLVIVCMTHPFLLAFTSIASLRNIGKIGLQLLISKFYSYNSSLLFYFVPRGKIQTQCLLMNDESSRVMLLASKLFGCHDSVALSLIRSGCYL